MQGAGVGAGVGGEQELHVVDAVRARHAPSGSSTSSCGPAGVSGAGVSCWVIAMVDRGVRHGQRGELVAHRLAEPSRSVVTLGAEGAGEVAELGADAVASGLQLGDLPVGVLEVQQPLRAVLGPREHLVDRLAVLAGERRQRRPSLRDGRETARVGLEGGGVGRDVAGEVDEQVAQLGEPVGELPGRRVVVADAVERPPRRAGRGQGVGGALLAGERLRGPSRPRCAACRRTRGASPRRRARRPPRGAGRPPRPPRGRTAAGRPPGRAREPSRPPRRASRSVTTSSAHRAAYDDAVAASASPPNRSSEARWAPDRSRRCWSDWPCTATRGSATSARVVTGTEAPPTQARERPCAATLRARTTWSSSTSPPASSTAVRKPSRSLTATTPSTRGLLGARAHGARVGPAAEQQPERGHDHRLARARLARDDGQAGPELERRGLDDARAD